MHDTQPRQRNSAAGQLKLQQENTSTDNREVKKNEIDQEIPGAKSPFCRKDIVCWITIQMYVSFYQK